MPLSDSAPRDARHTRQWDMHRRDETRKGSINQTLTLSPLSLPLFLLFLSLFLFILSLSLLPPSLPSSLTQKLQTND